LQTSDSNTRPGAPSGTPPETRRTTDKKSRAAFFIIPVSIIAILLLIGGLIAYSSGRICNPDIAPVSAAEEAMARTVYVTANRATVSPLAGAAELSPWTWKGDEPELTESIKKLTVHARSAILVDATTGAILFEKNADAEIPPASMTKLVSMFTAYHAVEAGEITFDDVVPLPKESWAVNIPPGSSLMFLGAGQKVTVRELLVGMAVPSGNDAAIALGIYVGGSVPAFVDRMNAEIKKLGLVHTHFVEPSGLSERNITTAREFADFALVYIRDYPEALKAFHSKDKIEYPMPWNLPEGSREKPVVQHATNKLLATLPGCDGLKTGFIRESGYNLSLTAERNGTRFLSVSLGGPGMGTSLGGPMRDDDGTALMEWAFANFRTVRPEKPAPINVTVWAGKSGGIEAIPALKSEFTAPDGIPGGTAASVETKVSIPKAIDAPVNAGDVIGKIDYLMDGKVVHTVPLLADRSVAKAGVIRSLPDMAAKFLSRYFK
jgi:D-alanyl-D-alanine carboxypeptidase (penicillin-binding protein 5/6)